MQDGDILHVDANDLLSSIRRNAPEVNASSDSQEDLDALESLVRGIYEMAEASDVDAAGYIRG
jgi:hypothetical protein